MARFGMDDNPGCGWGDEVWNAGGKGGCQGSATLLQASCKTRQNIWKNLQPKSAAKLKLRAVCGCCQDLRYTTRESAGQALKPAHFLHFQTETEVQIWVPFGRERGNNWQHLMSRSYIMLHPKKQTFDWSRSAIEPPDWSLWCWDIHKSLGFCSAKMDTPVYWCVYLQMYLERFSCSKVVDWYCQR